ncbi:MAG: PLP-dependent aminotransferase family protein [Leptospiraceae bacterium]|nr:PLP-dependent aminotransferase family protein [Leptospiraceae bacterium]
MSENRTRVTGKGAATVRRSAISEATEAVDSSEAARPLQLAQRLMQSMDEGEYPPGSRLPSIRASIRLSGFSQGTVVEAYRILLDLGRIRSVPGGGYYVSEASSVPRPAPSRILQRISLDPALDRALSLENQNVRAPFGLALPSEDLLPLASLKRCINEALRKPGGTGYSFPPGSMELRQEIAARYRQTGVSLHGDEVILTGGATQAAYIVLKEITRAGDLVALESPCYSGFLYQARGFDLKYLEVPVQSDAGLDLDVLEAQLKKGRRPRVLITVPNFQNPTGALLSEERRRGLIHLAHKYNFYIIEDDVYGGIHHGARRFPPLASLDRDRVFLISSFSKTIAPSSRLGWEVAPSGFQEKLLSRLRITTLGNSKMLEEAIAIFLRRGFYERHLRKLRRESRIRVGEIRRRLALSIPEARISSPEGGFLLWVELPEHVDGLEMQRRALEKGITLSPGSLYSPSGRYKNYIRLNCAVPMTDAILSCAEQIGTFMP